MELADKQTDATGLSLSDAGDIKAVAKSAGKHKKQLEKLSEEFDESNWLKLFWDAKVPQKEKRFWHFFTFRSSDKEEVKAEIKKYLDFYEEMGKIAEKIKDHKEGKARDACEEAVKLLGLLMNLYRKAEEETETTGSSTVYELHRQMVLQHKKLEFKIKQMECVARNMASDEIRKKLQQTNDSLVVELNESNKRHKDICDQMKELKTTNQDLIKAVKKLFEENLSLREQRNISEQLQLLEQQNEELREQRRVQK